MECFPPLKRHSSGNIIGFSSTVSGLVAIFKSLSLNDDLKIVNLLNQAVSKLPSNLEEAWSNKTVRRQGHQPTLPDFHEWLKEKAEGHERLKSLNFKGKSEEIVNQNVGTKVFACVAKKVIRLRFPPCSVCKAQHALWNCALFEEKNAMKRAQSVAEQKICFACLQSNHSFRNCSNDRKCSKPACESTLNVLLRGAEK